MCDEDSTFTERARSWLKESEPGQDEIQDAYSKMLAKLAKTPEIASADTDECLDLLVKAYGGVGGSTDGLLALVETAKASQPAEASADSIPLDFGNLYEVSDAPVVKLSKEEKRVAFLKLKAELSGMSGAVALESGSAF